MLRFLKEYFHFSRAQTNACILLLILIVTSSLTLIYVKNRPVKKQVAEHSISESNTPSVSAYSSPQKKNLNAYLTPENKTKNTSDPKYSNTKRKSPASSTIVRVNLNTEDSIQMIQKEIQPWLAKRIIKYRSLLGGYTKISQLKEVYGVKESTYNWLKKRCYIEDSFTPKKINVHNDTFKEILKHPYISYEDVKEIFKLRKNNGLSESNLEDLFGKDLYRKLVPYLAL